MSESSSSLVVLPSPESESAFNPFSSSESVEGVTGCAATGEGRQHMIARMRRTKTPDAIPAIAAGVKIVDDDFDEADANGVPDIVGSEGVRGNLNEGVSSGASV